MTTSCALTAKSQIQRTIEYQNELHFKANYFGTVTSYCYYAGLNVS